MSIPTPTPLPSRPRRPSVRTLLCVLAIFCASIASVAQTITQQFIQPTVESTGGIVTNLATGDFNNTGLSDILFANAPVVVGGVSQITVGELFQQQNFGYQLLIPGNQITFQNASNVVATVADFDGDGYLDFAFAVSRPIPLSGLASPPSQLCVYYGTGAGITGNAFSTTKSGCMSFTLQGTQSPNFAYIVTSTFTTGGLPNVILEDTANNWVYVLANSGHVNTTAPTLSTFTLKSSFLNGDGPGPLYIGDLNGDGKTDLVVNGSAHQSYTTWLGSGAGTYSTSAQSNAAGKIHSMLLHDLDGDGHLDLVAEGANGTISIYHGNDDATGSFASTSIGGTAPLDGTSGNGGHLIAVADVNGDGKLDLVTATPAGISVLLGEGNGSGSYAYQLRGIYNAGPGHTAYAFADFNGDTLPDLAVDSPQGVAVLNGNSNGSFQTEPAYAAGAPGLGAVVGKFRTIGNFDSALDAVVATGATQSQVLFGNGDGTFGDFPSSTPANPVATPANLWSNLLTGDFNGDKIPDLAYSLTGLPLPTPGTTAGTGLYIELGKGDGTFQTPVAVTPASVGAPPSNNFYGESTVADFNGDGLADLANSDAFYLDTLLSKGSGNFGVALNSVVASPQSFSLVAAGPLHAARLTLQDLVFQNGATITPYLNGGDGKTFTAEPSLTGTPSASSLYPATILVHDMDGDGNGDIVVLYHNLAATPANPSTATANQLYVWYGNGDGTFGAPYTATLSRNYYLGAVADMDGDGKPDLVLSDGYLVGILFNVPTRSFGRELDLLAGQGINSISLDDLNGDGSSDIVVANGGAAISNPIALGGKSPGTTSLTLPVNPDVNTGGITVLLNYSHTRVVTGTLTASPEPSTFGATFTVTAALTPATTGSTPTGTVQFNIDGSPVGAAAVAANGSATLVIPAGNTYAVGQHALAAVYSGDVNYAGLSFTGTHNILAATFIPTTTVLALCIEGSTNFPCPANPQTQPPIITPLSMYYGQVFNGTEQAVSSDGSTLSPTSTLAFYDNGSLLCTITVVAGQQCPAMVGMGETAGTHVFTSSYSGDATHAPSTSNPITINVLPDTVTATITTSLNPAYSGQSVTFTATFTGNYAAPTGLADFSELFPPTALAKDLGTAPLFPGSGLTSTATFTTNTLPVGADTISTTNEQNPNFATGIATLIENILPVYTTTTSLTSSVNPSAPGQSVTFTATVAATGSATTIPTGPVTFLDGTTTLGTVTLNASGIATFTTSALALGSHNITATYAGNLATTSSVSAVLVQVVASNAFTLTVTPTPINLGVGRSASLVVTVSSSTLSPAVTLSCSNLPTESACTFAQTTIPAGGGSTTLILSTSAPHACGTTQPYFLGFAGHGDWPTALPFGAPIFAGLVTFGLGFRRRRSAKGQTGRRWRARLLKSLLTALAVAAVFQVSGCGNCTDLGTSPGTYLIQVTATGAGTPPATASQAITLNVTL